MPFRFVHTADIHLDSPLRSLALKDPALADLIGNASREVFIRIIDLCIEERVDALFIAGDLYDGDQTSMKTASFLARELKRLEEAGIRAFIIRGNHDAMSRITRELVLPGNVTLFGTRAEVSEIEAAGGLRLAIHGMSFKEPKAPESLLPRYQPPRPDAVNLGLMHTSLNGAAGHDPYAPCSVSDLAESGFRYWALGHIHARSVRQGRTTIVMPGIPQGRDINEGGEKSVTLVTVGDDGAITLEERMVAIARFERLAIDCSEAADWAHLADMMGRALDAAAGSPDGVQRIFRVRLGGVTPLAYRMRRDRDLLQTQAALHGEGRGIWIESLDSAATPLETKSADGVDPVRALARLIDDTVLPSPAFSEAANEVIQDIERALPGELRGFLGNDEAAVAAIIAELAREGADDVLSRLMSDEREGRA